MLSLPIVQCIGLSTEINIWLLAVFYSPVLKPVWQTLIVLLGRRDEPQLLSDVNAAQTLCSCGHSSSNSSNQLMGYHALCSSPLRFTHPVQLDLAMDVTDKSEWVWRAYWHTEWIPATYCHLHLRMSLQAAGWYKLSCVSMPNHSGGHFRVFHYLIPLNSAECRVVC